MEISFTDIIRYYLVWADGEKELIANIKDGDLASFKAYLTGMKVIRNIKKGTSSQIFKTADDFIQNNKRLDAEKLSEKLNKEKLLSGKNKNCIVLASKVLWVLNHNAIIKDSLSEKSLRKLSAKKIKTYKEFCMEWETQYKIFQPKAIKIINKYSLSKISHVFKEEWFLRRTFDNYLWAMGKKI